VAAAFAEDAEAGNASALESELHGGFENAEAVGDAATEINGGSFLEILGGAGDFADAESEVNALGEHLVVENEVVAVFAQGKARQDFAAEGAVAGVVFGELDAEEEIFKRGEQAVGDVFVERHAAAKGGASDDAGAEDNIVNAVGDHAGHGGDEQGRVLVIGVKHDDDVGAGGEGLAITGLLVPSVAVIAVMDEMLDAEFLRDFDGAVLAVIIDQDAGIDEVGKLADGGFEGFLRIVGGQNYRDALAVDHASIR